MVFQAKWIRSKRNLGDVCPEFLLNFSIRKEIREAQFYITALGIYEAELNGNRVGRYVFAPGWTAYKKRIQYQVYDVTEMLKKENSLHIRVGKGWYRSPMPGWIDTKGKEERVRQREGVICELHIHFMDGESKVICSDDSWLCRESRIRFGEIYDGEVFDAAMEAAEPEKVEVFEGPTDLLVIQEGEEVREMERIRAQDVIITPRGETVIDFGQEITGYVEFSVMGRPGQQVHIQHGEMLDGEGNFYNANYRSAKSEIYYICRQGWQTWHPSMSYFGFRYIKVEGIEGEVVKEQFTGIAVYSNLKRTGEFCCSNSLLNRLFSNIIWSQKDNFLDIPTDCAQRDERLGWTGDAQVFVRAASYNYDVDKFFCKWLHDLALEQRPDGAIGQVVPDYLEEADPSAGWGDAAVIIPWQIYLTYGNDKILCEQFNSMKKWVDYITDSTTVPGLWAGGNHFGDWLGLDAPQGSYKGASREEFIASAFYARSAELLVKAGRVIGQDVDDYEKLYQEIVAKFQKTYTEYRTQTEYALAIFFGLAIDLQAAADGLAEKICSDGNCIRTGFIGTPYLLHSLSRYRHAELAYTLLLKKTFPSWLYPVTKNATTIWEHWDGIREDGSMWSEDMNSFCHYSYGSVADWLYEEAAGIHLSEDAPGFQKVVLAPKADKRLEWLQASINTRNGKIVSRWEWEGDTILYTFETEMPARIRIGNLEEDVKSGIHTYKV